MGFWEEYDRKTTFLESRRMPEEGQWEAIYQCIKDLKVKIMWRHL